LSGPGWREVTGPCGIPLQDRSLSYVAADGSLAVYTDQAHHETVVVHRPELDAEDRRVLANWRGTTPGPHPVTLGESVEGYGVFTFPYGPVSMGVPESGTFDLRTYGERVLELVPGVGYKSRGIATSVIGRRWEDAALSVERLAGNFSASHVSAFLQAFETAEQRPVAPLELWVRAMTQELQRIYNHLHVIARIAEAASQNVGAAQLHALAEDTLRIAGRFFGHRWMFGALLPGGPPRRLESGDRGELGGRLLGLGREFDEIWELLLVSRTFIDRIQSTAPVSAKEAIRWGAVGPTLRACGVAWDDRLRAASHPYTDLFVSMPLERDGDALARVLVRSSEIRASLLLIEQMLERWPRPSSGEILPAPCVEPGRGVARVEGPSGDLIYDVSSKNGIVRFLGLRSASQSNWPLFALGMRNAVFTDFHFALESFGLVFADTDG
jgi:Ni,Fe-hydrogenase III large subunit